MRRAVPASIRILCVAASSAMALASHGSHGSQGSQGASASGPSFARTRTPAVSAADPSPRSHTLRLRGLLKKTAPRTLSVEQMAAAVRAGKPVGTSITSAFKDESPARYLGVDLRELRNAFALPTARRARLVAVNRYEQTIDLDPARGPAAVLAFEREGKPIPPHARGSFRVMMDLAGLPPERKEALFPYFVWSVGSVEFLP